MGLIGLYFHPRISLVILLSIYMYHSVLLILVHIIWYWINLKFPYWYFSWFSSLVWLIWYWYCEVKFSHGHSWKCRVTGNLHSLFCIENSYLAVLTGVVKWLIRPDDSIILTRSNRFSQNTACLFLDLLPCIEQQVTEDQNSSISRGLINNIYNIYLVS